MFGRLHNGAYEDFCQYSPGRDLVRSSFELPKLPRTPRSVRELDQRFSGTEVVSMSRQRVPKAWEAPRESPEETPRESAFGGAKKAMRLPLPPNPAFESRITSRPQTVPSLCLSALGSKTSSSEDGNGSHRSRLSSTLGSSRGEISFTANHGWDLSSLSMTAGCLKSGVGKIRGRRIISSWTPQNVLLHWRLDVSNRHLETLQTWIWYRQNLRVLDISRNKLRSIPEEISMLSGLQELLAHENRLLALPLGLHSLTMLQKLNLENNKLQQIQAEFLGLRNLREVRLKHNVIFSCFTGWADEENQQTSIEHLEIFDASYNALVEFPTALLWMKNLREINLSHNNISQVPVEIRALNRLTHLDVSYNSLKAVPAMELRMCMDTSASAKCFLGCEGNIYLNFPPPEIAAQGGTRVVQYIRAAVCGDGDVVNKEMVLAVMGDGEAGKTSTIRALCSSSSATDKIGADDRTVGISLRNWQPEGRDVTLQVMDLAGQSVYSMMHQFFFFRRAVYTIIWRVRPSIHGRFSESERRHLESMITRWFDTLQLHVPGAFILLAATHVDTCSPEITEMQCSYVQQLVTARLAHYQDGQGDTNLALKVFNNGKSICVDCLSGRGIPELRHELLQFIESTPWYHERIPGPYLQLRLSIVKLNGDWILWKTYDKMAKECGVTGDHLPICTRFLHDIGVLRYFGNCDEAITASSERLRQDMMLDTVFTSMSWIVDVIKGLIRHDREELLSFFTTSDHADKRMSLRVNRLITHGVVHPSLVPFLWPRVSHWTYPGIQPAVIRAYWERCQSEGSSEANIWIGNVATEPTGLLRALGLLEGLDIAILVKEDDTNENRKASLKELAIGGLNGKILLADSLSRKSLVVPGLLSGNRLFRVDSRVFGDECLFRCVLWYALLPSGFFERLIVRLRRIYSHMDHNSNSAALYRMGDKLQLFVKRVTVESSTPTFFPDHEGDEKLGGMGHYNDVRVDEHWELLVLFSSSKLWDNFYEQLQLVELCYPGLNRTGFHYDIANSAASRRALLIENQSSDSVSSVSFRVSSISLTPLPSSEGSRHTLGLNEILSKNEIIDKVLELERTLKTQKDAIKVLISASHSSQEFSQTLMEELNELDPTLCAEVQRTEDEYNPLVLLCCFDESFVNTPECRAIVKQQAHRGHQIIPLILRRYTIKDYASWWPSSMPEMKQHSLFIDLRGEEWYEQNRKRRIKEYYRNYPDKLRVVEELSKKADPWARTEMTFARGEIQAAEKTERKRQVKVLYEEIKKGLDAWRGDAPRHTLAGGILVEKGEDHHVACVMCVKEGEQHPHYFDRRVSITLKEQWITDSLKAREHKDKEPELPTIKCRVGHLLQVDDVLSSAVIFDSVPCPSCVEFGTIPPHCFLRQLVLSSCDENNVSHGTLSCPKCMRKGQPPIRVLEILSPDVFLSYQWGVQSELPTGEKRFSTQELAKRHRRAIELNADVLCWLDCEGGLEAGKDHVQLMIDGIFKAHVVVIFLSDAYINSVNCQREFRAAVQGHKYIIPVLIPPVQGEPWSGWTGPGKRDTLWWMHAKRVTHKPPREGAIAVDWHALSYFEPLDMREYSDFLVEEGDGEHPDWDAGLLNQLVARILRRFHRGIFIVHQKEKKLWKKLTAASRLLMSGTFLRTTSSGGSNNADDAKGSSRSV